MQHAKQKLIDLGIEFGPKAATAILIMVIGFFAAPWLGRMFENWLAKVPLEPPVRLLLLRVLRLIIFGLFLIYAI